MLDFLLPFADAGFTIVQAVFAVNLTATIYRQFKERASTVSLFTSGTTAPGLLVLATLQLALGLVFASVTAAVSAGLWAVIAGQRVYYERRVVSDVKIAETYSPRSWHVGDTMTHEDRRYKLTRLEEVAPTPLVTGGQARCWQIYGRLIDEQA